MVAGLRKEPLFSPFTQKYKVDLALWGHHHSYQRTCPVYALKCTPGAPVHVVIGMAGQGLSHNLRYVVRDIASWTELSERIHGWT